MVDDKLKLRLAAAPTLRRLEEVRLAASPELAPVFRFVERHFSCEGADRDGLRRFLGDQADELLSAFASEVGVTPEQLIGEARLETGLRLLISTDFSVTRIARLLGYLHGSDFRRSFKKWTGLKPGTFRQCYLVYSSGLPEEALSIDGRHRALRGMLSQRAGRRLVDALRAGHDRQKALPLDRDLVKLLWSYLRALPLSGKRQILKCHVRTRGVFLFEYLSALGQEEGRKNREAGVDLAELALICIETCRSRLGDRYSNICALAWARLGDAWRRAGNHFEAESAFARAGSTLEVSSKAQEPGIVGEILGLGGSLRLFQRRYDEASALLADAADAAKEAGDNHLLAKVLLQKVAVMYHNGWCEDVIRDLNNVMNLDGIDRVTELHARQTLGAAYIRLGQCDEARPHLDQAEKLSTELSRGASSLQIKWLRAQMALEDGDLCGAEMLYRDALNGLVEIGDINYASEVALELAILLQEQERSDEVIPLLSVDVLPAFETLRLHREGFAALRLLQQAVKSGDLQIDVLREARDCLKRLRLEPALQARREYTCRNGNG